MVVTAVTHYGNSELVYVDSNEYGSGEWVSKAFVFWTEAPLYEIQAHYDRFFDMQPTKYHRSRLEGLEGRQEYPWMTLIWLPFDYNTVFTVEVLLFDADQEYRQFTIPCCYFDGAVEKVDQLPHEGTIIVIVHTVFRS